MRLVRFGTTWVVCGLLSVGGWLVGSDRPVAADDWPQWMGRNRDNHWVAENIIERFPPGGPPILWRAPVAGGYAGPAVVGERLVVGDWQSEGDVRVDNFNRATYDGHERVLCFDAHRGQLLWEHRYPLTYTISYPAGPRCTPTIDGDRVYHLGAEGHLKCLRLVDGEVLWECHLPTEFDTQTPLWGYASHPLIDGPRLIVVAGGEGSHTVAFDKLTGRVLWKNGTANEQGYSPPTMIEVAGRRQLISANPQAVNAFDPETGELLWSEPYEATNGSIIMSPLLIDQRYLFVGGFSNRNLLLELDPNEPRATTLVRDKPKHFVSPVNVQPLVQDGVVYGMDQRGDLLAFRVPGGERLWESNAIIGQRSRGSETGFFVRYRDRYFVFNELGELLIVRLSPEGCQVLDRTPLLPPTNNAFGRDVLWCAPALAHGRLYVRNDETLICVDLTEPGSRRESP
jgi:outer membrane protein assembly factor BamB